MKTTPTKPTTPETSKAWDDVSRTPDGQYDSSVSSMEYAIAMLEHSRKMERQRDEARQLAEKFARNADVIFHWENVENDKTL